MNPQKLTLYFPYWQRERVMCLGYWVEETNANINRLERYIMDFTSLDDRMSRDWRVLNLCNATIMALNGTKNEVSPAMTKIVGFRDAVGEEYRIFRPRHNFVVPAEEDVIFEWKDLTVYEQTLIRKNLTGRRQKHISSTYRPELSWFLNIIGGLQ